MRKQTLRWTPVILTGVSVVLALQAAEAKLTVGDPAPKLQVAKWAQGDPVKEFAPGKAYLVEFWATWCGPCKVSIPHLNELHAKFKDKGLIVIGQDCWERDDGLVAPFIEKMGEKMTYRVALDDKSKDEKGAMAMTWMAAANQNGIPTAFVVNKQGKIAWIGHPMSLQEKTLEDVLADRYDLAKAAADYEKGQVEQAQRMEQSRKLNMALREKNWDQAEAALTEMEKQLPEKQRDGYSMTRFQILVGRGDYDAGYKLLRAFSEAHADNAVLQNQIAWTIVANPQLSKRDLALAEQVAERGNKAAKGKDANILDTLARAQFMNGKKDKAIETQQKAVELADEEMKEKFQKLLASYKAGELPSAD